MVMDMYCYIYGAGERGREALQLINIKYNGSVKIKGFLDQNKSGEIEGIKIYGPAAINYDIDTILIAIEDRDIALDIYLSIRKKTKARIYWFSGKRSENHRDFFSEQCISCELWKADMLWQAEIHIYDACNLNCRGCAHYAPIFEKIEPNFNDRIGDIKKFNSKFSHIVFFYLLGGEPFLNPEIGKYAAAVREIMPDTEIVIVTNGILIPRIDDEILCTIRKSRVKISISEYYPTHKLRDQIIKKLEDNDIVYEWRKLNGKQKFNMPLSLSSDSKRERICISNTCVNIWNGMMARCPQLMYIDKFNHTFGTNLPNQGIIYLDDERTGLELLNELKKPVPLCNHCIKNEIEWSVCGKNVVVSDFAIDD